MIYLFDTFFFVLGAIIGSFLNVIILRYNTGESVVDGRSHCFSCGKMLKWFELVPVLSFLFLRGRCSNCKSKISWQYPLVEVVTGIVYLLVFLKIQQIPDWQNLSVLVSTIFTLVVFSILIVISVYDIRHQIIPDACAYVLAGITLVPVLYKLFYIESFSKLSNPTHFQGFSAGLFLAAFFAFFWLVSRGKWMGLGDAKLSLGVGWFLGLPKTLVALVFSFWLGAIVGVTLIILEKKKYKINSAIPFGPFLAIGALLAFIFGDVILKDYIYYFNVI
jgi:leader peptidase (prepilin peptidase)/N-methyltransferase